MVLIGPYIGHEIIFGVITVIIILWMVYGLGSGKFRNEKGSHDMCPT
jgi:hypothetical protein